MLPVLRSGWVKVTIGFPAGFGDCHPGLAEGLNGLQNKGEVTVY